MDMRHHVSYSLLFVCNVSINCVVSHFIPRASVVLERERLFFLLVLEQVSCYARPQDTKEEVSFSLSLSLRRKRQFLFDSPLSQTHRERFLVYPSLLSSNPSFRGNDRRSLRGSPRGHGAGVVVVHRPDLETAVFSGAKTG